MRLGLLPSQQRELRRAFKKARALDGFRQRTRRQFAAGGVLAFATTVGAFFFGRWRGRSEGEALPALDERVALGRRLATASDQALWDGAATFLVVLDSHPNDPLLWAGFARLARMVLERRDQQGTALGRRLLKSADAAGAPEFAAPFVAPLRRLGK